MNLKNQFSFYLDYVKQKTCKTKKKKKNIKGKRKEKNRPRHEGPTRKQPARDIHSRK